MKTFKIAKKMNQVLKTEVINNPSLKLSGNSICLSMTRSKAEGISSGSKLHFIKRAVGNDGKMVKVCETDVVVSNVETEGNTIRIYFDYLEIQPLTVVAVEKIPEGSESPFNYKLFFSSETLIAQGNAEKGIKGDFKYFADNSGVRGGYMVYIIRSCNKDKCDCAAYCDATILYTELGLCYPGETVAGMDIHIGDETECCNPFDRYFNYETLERNAILATMAKAVVGSGFEPMPGDRVLLCTNPYYFVTPGENRIVKLFENVDIEKYTDFLNIPTVLEQDYDAKRMFQEYQVNELFVKKIKNSVIPGFIDLEKVKYAPAFFVEDKKEGDDEPGEETEEVVTGHIQLATGLTFNLHFRQRVFGSELYSFADIWHLDDDTSEWNGNGFIFDANGIPYEISAYTREHLYDSEEFVNMSNLVGYLGFTDEDVYNQKNKIKKTFLRLSFYDNPNPLEQHLLYYSTIFMDGGDLFSKYVKKKAELMENDEYDEEILPVVWASASTEEGSVSSVTSQFIVNDEYDNTRSGEGFNLYLFREDAPIENQWKDIYMKVEFNHAGYGRTVPLIFWKKDEETGEPEKLTIDNYVDHLYLKLSITLSDDGYVYMFDDAVSAEDEDNGGRRNGIVWENERLVLNLFEPRIESDYEPD